MSNQFEITRGRPLPLGATNDAADSINFSILSRHATAVNLVIYGEDGGSHPVAEIPLDPRKNRTGDHWHVRLHGLPDTFCFGWRVDGPKGPKHRLDPTRVLIDPACTLLSNGAIWAGTCEIDPERTSRRSLFNRGPRYDWGDDAPPLTPHEDTIIYEVHVRGFTFHPTSGVQHPGTFLGLIEKLPYLKDLGVTAIELLPVHEFDECDCPFDDPETGERLVNFWGYNTIAFASPKAAFATSAKQHGQVVEFRDLVKAAHQHGIEVYLDVVFNHTGEGDDRGRTYNLRGFDNELYYLMSESGQYLNFSGVGNTVNCNHPLVRDLILSCLRFWVGNMHVDGFRFDLASILGRDRHGHVMIEPPVVEMIAEDGVLADTKLIAEPWDAAGLYQVGGFPFGRRWSEWNGKYRDDIRRFWRGDPGMTGLVATRICGSSDLYQSSGRLPRHSVNFVTCHDGFTLWDLVSYNHKHNHRNGENGRDGSDANFSWNSGVEGATDQPEIQALRMRRAKGMMATLMLSQGVPMILAGDEFLRTQHGNNNAWCQDNEISWMDWRLAEKNADFLRFTKELISLRRRHPVFRRRRFFLGEFGPVARKETVAPFPSAGRVRPGEAGLPTDPTGRQVAIDGISVRTPAPMPTIRPLADIHWHGTHPFQPDFGPESRLLAFSLDGRFTGRDGSPDYQPDNDFYVVMNVAPSTTQVWVPPSPTGRVWHRLIDTCADSPNDILPDTSGAELQAWDSMLIPSFGMIVLISEL